MSTITTTSVLNRNARSSRQSGLKKPRPLRSISLQEPTDKDVQNQRIFAHRQLSSGYQDSGEDNVTRNDFPVSEGIFAMSAMITAQPESDNTDYPQATQERPSYSRQNSSSSYNSYMDSETGSSLLSRQNSGFSEDNHSSTPEPDGLTQPVIRKVIRTSRYSFSKSYSQNDADYSPKELHVDVNSNNLDLSDFSSGKDVVETAPMVSLMTPQGERLSVSGKNMKTVLGAAKILVREIGARIVSLRVHNTNEDNTSPIQSTKTNSNNNSLSPAEASIEEKSEEVIRYSKDELLALSESDLARIPPSNWNILTHTHADCCPPTDKLKEYFEVIDFHAHDGTLVMGDKRLHERPYKEKTSLPNRF